MKIQKLDLKEMRDLISDKYLLPFNREIQPKHVHKMYHSIAECGLLRLPVVGKLMYEKNQPLAIIDGQHLISALVLYKVKEIEVIVKDYDKKRDVIHDIAKLNNTQKTWNDANYLDAWFKYGKDNLTHFTNYSYLNNLYQTSNMACGFLVDCYGTSKKDFKAGELTFWDREYSDKIYQIADWLQTEFKKSTHTLQGLRMWAKKMYKDKKDVDFNKLRSRLNVAIRNNEDKNANGREDFIEFINAVYTRI